MTAHVLLSLLALALGVTVAWTGRRAPLRVAAGTGLVLMAVTALAGLWARP